MRRFLLALAVCGVLLPAAFARSTGPIAARTGFAADGGQNCTACHRTTGAANSDTRGKVEIAVEKLTYTPGIKQNITIRVSHPEAMRWGFQLTARSTNSPTQMAGSFSVTPTVIVRCGNGDLITAVSTTTAATCGGQTEFASHNADSTRNGTRQGVSWTVEWTPPANEVGEIILAAAGNAANGDGTNSGDYIYTTELRLKAEGACSLTKKPTLRSLSNAGSFVTTLSPNVLASVFGGDFSVPGRTRAAGPGDFVSGGFPAELACIAVDIAGRRAPITYIQADQINFQVPAGTPTGPVPVTIIANPGYPNELRSDQGTVTVAQYSPAWFTFNGQSIAALTPDYKVVADPAVVAGGVAAPKGSVVILYGTGFGFTDPVYQAGEIPPGTVTLPRGTFTVTVGGTQLTDADILYAGLAPSLISGLYQFNVRIPTTVASGKVPVVVTVGSLSTQTAGGVIPVQ